MAKQKVSVELKPKKNTQKDILYPGRRKKREREARFCYLSQASAEVVSKYQKEKLENSHNNVYYLGGFFFTADQSNYSVLG